MAEPRLNKITLVVGAPGCGKTTYIKTILSTIGRKALVYDINSERAYMEYPKIQPADIARHTSGIARVYSENDKELLGIIDKQFYNGLVVFEDSTIYMQNATAPHIRSLLTNFRHRNRDYIFTFHSFRRIPPFLYEMSNYIAIFKTQDSPSHSSDKIPNLTAVLNAHLKVQKSKDPHCKIVVNTRP